MKVLLTGASGFIGCALSKQLLQAGYDVSAITRDASKLRNISLQLKPIIGDLCSSDLSFVNVNEFDLIFNCAGELKNKALMKVLHVDATKKLLAKLQSNKARWVQLSSVGVYGRQMDGIITEENDFNPVGEYEKTKAEADVFVKNYCLESSIPFSIVRPSNVFANDMPNDSLRALIKAIQSGLFFYMGEADDIRANYVHVDDVVDTLIACGLNQNAVNQDFIISDSLSQKEFVRIICQMLDKPEPKICLPQPFIRASAMIFGWLPRFPLTKSRIDALTTRTTYSRRKLEYILGFELKKTIRTGLKDFIVDLYQH